ncbi:hypothetical protein VJJ19_07590, partial [Parvimonas sp. D4]
NELSAAQGSLNGTINSVKADVTTLRGDLSSARADIATVGTNLATEVDRAKADTASIRTVQGQMQQDISGNLSRIQTEEINRATAVSALSN